MAWCSNKWRPWKQYNLENAGRKIFEVEKDGHGNSNHANLNHFESNHSGSIYANLINIKLINQHDSTNYHLLQKMMLWSSNNTQADENSTTSQSSTFSTRTMPHNFTYRTSYPPPPLNGQKYPASVTPTGNCMPHNNSPKLVLHIPIEPDADPFIVFLFVRLIWLIVLWVF